MSISERTTEETQRTSLDGLIFPIDPTDPIDCFGKQHSDYLNKKLLMILIDGKYYPLSMCGDTNTGMNWYGCSHGEVSGGLSCEWSRTGEKVTAQACILDKCSNYVLDATKSPHVLIAKIDDQWHIVNVITGDGLPDTDDVGRIPCSNACCGQGITFLEATISSASCPEIDGEVFELASSNGGGIWQGILTLGNFSFEFQLFCSVDVEDANDWSALGGCGSLSNADSLTVDCLGTGTSDSLTGVATFNNPNCNCSTGTGGTGEIVVSFVSKDKRPSDLCKTDILTGTRVIAESCDLSLSVGDEVIIAEVDKESGATGTGTGTSAQWHVVRVCSGDLDCLPCPPPDPPDPLDCCGMNTETAPQTLVGTVSVSSIIDGCSCPETVITFELNSANNPPEWNQVGSINCPDSTGTSVTLDLLSGMVIRCSDGTGTSPGISTGTGKAFFFLTPPQCVSQSDIPSNIGQCDPVMATWENINIRGCCGPVLDLDISSDEPVYMTLEISE